MHIAQSIEENMISHNYGRLSTFSQRKQILNKSKLLMVASNSVAARVNAGKPCYVLGILLITQMQLHVSLAHTGVLEFTYFNDGNIF